MSMKIPATTEEMMERRRAPRTLARGNRIWLAQPHERWALLQDVSHDGLRVIAGPLKIGTTLVVRRELTTGFSEARIAEVVHCDGHRAGLRFLLERNAEIVGQTDRRLAVRIATHGLTAWIKGTVETPAVVRDVSATGARIESILPLKPNQCVQAELVFGDNVICERRARVVRCRGDEVGLQFVDFDTEAA